MKKPKKQTIMQVLADHYDLERFRKTFNLAAQHSFELMLKNREDFVTANLESTPPLYIIFGIGTKETVEEMTSAIGLERSHLERGFVFPS